MISETQIILRILLGAALGAVIGFERERDNQPAGLRTHMILVIGATLAMVLSVNLGYLFARPGTPADPARLAAQVISGIGFLGAGAILRYGFNVKGLTTATSLWTMAIVGLAVGAGYYLIGVVTTALMLLVLGLLNVIENRFVRTSVSRYISLQADYRKGVVKEIRLLVNEFADTLLSFTIQKHVKNKRIRIQIVARIHRDQTLEELVDGLSDIEGVRSLKVE
ncbi:MAG: MgtC/SapB family protein [Anaerolineaceae bacterium]|jgi:putative Mg2+ transporter-C (MgtC) family protein|nr:MgtC/SapB family protein [Anaerolineaceae bacterium]